MNITTNIFHLLFTDTGIFAMGFASGWIIGAYGLPALIAWGKSVKARFSTKTK